MKVLIFLAMLFFSLTSANNLSLDEEISLMREAPANERYKLMNNIKRRIASMNSASRAEAISKIKSVAKHITDSKMNQNRIHVNPVLHGGASNPQGILNQHLGGKQQFNNPTNKK